MHDHDPLDQSLKTAPKSGGGDFLSSTIQLKILYTSAKNYKLTILAVSINMRINGLFIPITLSGPVYSIPDVTEIVNFQF